jgi:transglutaminase-like putative cysteine protease
MAHPSWGTASISSKGPFPTSGHDYLGPAYRAQSPMPKKSSPSGRNLSVTFSVALPSPNRKPAMRISYGCELSIVVNQPTATFCLLDIHPDRRADIVEERSLAIQPDITEQRMRCVRQPSSAVRAPAGETRLTLSGIISDSWIGEPRDPRTAAMPAELLPTNVSPYLNGSRYCETDLLGGVAWNAFGSLPRNGALVQSICDFVNARITFDYEMARNTRTALQAYEERAGVCRDFVHLAITLCRCLNIPARYVNGYLADIGVPFNPAPMDFNARFEVYLDGAWHTYDARHNQSRIGRLPIARGRDACDVPMLQTFGPHILNTFTVLTEEVVETVSAAAA